MSNSDNDVPTLHLGPNLAVSAGADYMLFGFIADCVLLGIALGQTIYYYRAYPKDRRYIKIFVAICMLVELADYCSLAEALYFWTIACKSPENHADISIFPPTLLNSFFATDLLEMLIRVFYAFRVWHLSRKNIYVTGLIMLLVLVDCGFAYVLDVHQVVIRSTSTIHSRFSLVTYSASLTGAAMSDIAITVASIYYLHSQRTGFTATENVIDRLIVFSANIGLVTSVATIINLILLVALPKNYSFLTCQLVIGNLYVNSMLMTLNWRHNFRSTLENRTAHLVNTRTSQSDTHDIIAVDIELESRADRNIVLATVPSSIGSNPEIISSPVL